MYRRLSQAVVQEFELAEKISGLFPPPWKPDREIVGALLDDLVGFGGDVLVATADIERMPQWG
jgi:hypothetical protein